ncbi:MAG: SPASM domain-containing protein, partial [Niameybacter sp.]
NGTLLHKVQEVLINAPALRQVNISLHSFEANNSEVDLETYITQIADFVEQATTRSNIICSIRLWNMDSEVLKASNILNTDIISLLEDKLKLDFSIREKLIDNKGVKLGNHVYLNMAEKLDWPDLDKEEMTKEVFCYGLRDQMGILVDGTVIPCCLDSEGHIPLGNVFESPLEVILNSERAKKIYEGFSNRCAVEELCKRCGYATRY